MEVFLYNSTVCRLCGEENDSGNLLYSSEDNNQKLCDLINTYLPIKVHHVPVLPVVGSSRPSIPFADVTNIQTVSETVTAEPIAGPSRNHSTQSIATQTNKEKTEKETKLFEESSQSDKQKSEKEKKLYQKCCKYMKKTCQLKNRIKHLKRKEALKMIYDDDTIKKLSSKISPSFALLLQGQLRNYKKKASGRRWSKEEKIISLRIFKRSPTCYRLLRRMFELPSPTTLKCLLNKVPFNVGVNKPIFEVLKSFIKCQKPSSNEYVLMFDEMSIKKNLQYNCKSDLIEGYQDHGTQGRSPNIAAYALVFMIAGIRQKVKQPVAHYLSSGFSTADRLAVLIKEVSDDGILPRTICPGCTIQLEATVEFLNLIINGQKVIRELHLREKEYKKSILNTDNESEVITEKIVYEINTSDGVYQVEHPISLQVAGLEKPKRKRGRPPKKPKSPEEIAQELAAREKELAAKKQTHDEEITGKRRRKTPTRFKEAVQGKELERIFKEEGVIDENESEAEVKVDPEQGEQLTAKEPEVIGHMENSGELVVVVKGKGRGRPKGRMRQTREECSICGMEFYCVGRYMSHVAMHGPVLYRCAPCGATHHTLIQHQAHQRETAHVGHVVIPCKAEPTPEQEEDVEVVQEPDPLACEPEVNLQEGDDVPKSLPKLIPDEGCKSDTPAISSTDFLKDLVNDQPNTSAESSPSVATSTSDIKALSSDNQKEKSSDVEVVELGPTGKPKLKCNHCEKTFNSKQSKSLHIKAVHLGEKPYACAECGCRFAYPRSLALHALSHRRHRAAQRRYACDLCGKVLNHPSSVVYHKEAEHANQRYVCSKCGKSFKHKQLLQRHQLVHSQVRPYSCKTCNASFKTKANLINHQLLHSGVKKFSCEICKHKFAHKTSLTLHMRWHTGSKPFGCKICGKSFSQKGNLSEHERIHSGEKPYQCTQCPRRFTTSSQFRLHARRHQSERPYACAHCPKRFVSRGSWLAHSRREAGVRAHACAVCARSFAERWALVKHMRKHTGERPFRCPHCPRTFADCSNLNKHKKQVHKQISLLVNNDKNQQIPEQQQQQQQQQQQLILQHTQQQQQETVALAAVPSEVDDDVEEGVIYVTYDVDDSQPGFTIMGPEQVQAANVQETKVLNSCSLFPGPVLVSQPELGAHLGLAALTQEQLHALSPNQHALMEDDDAPGLMLNGTEHITVTDEQGNPLQFTMQDGTRLAITSSDGKSLQVITQDGQTIPVEINGFEEEAEDNPEAVPVMQQVSLQKTVDPNSASPVTHYFTIV